MNQLIALVTVFQAFCSSTVDSVYLCSKKNTTWMLSVASCLNEHGTPISFDKASETDLQYISLKPGVHIWTADFFDTSRSTSNQAVTELCGFSYLESASSGYETLLSNCSVVRNYFCFNNSTDKVEVLRNTWYKSTECGTFEVKDVFQKPGYYWLSTPERGTLGHFNNVELGMSNRIYCGAYGDDIGSYFRKCIHQNIFLCNFAVSTNVSSKFDMSCLSDTLTSTTEVYEVKETESRDKENTLTSTTAVYWDKEPDLRDKENIHPVKLVGIAAGACLLIVGCPTVLILIYRRFGCSKHCNRPPKATRASVNINDSSNNGLPAAQNNNAYESIDILQDNPNQRIDLCSKLGKHGTNTKPNGKSKKSAKRDKLLEGINGHDVAFQFSASSSTYPKGTDSRNNFQNSVYCFAIDVDTPQERFENTLSLSCQSKTLPEQPFEKMYVPYFGENIYNKTNAIKTVDNEDHESHCAKKIYSTANASALGENVYNKASVKFGSQTAVFSTNEYDTPMK